MQRITIHQSDLEKLKIKLNDSKYLEYIWHKFLDNPNATWSEDILKKNKNWSYPDCWLTRYYTYYDNCKNFIENKKILDIGSCFSFYSAWAILNGASHVDCIEPSKLKSELAKEYIKIRKLDTQITIKNLDIEYYFNNETVKNYDTVFYLDVFEYMVNPVLSLELIKTKINPKYIFFESGVADDLSHNNSGYLNIWTPSVDEKKLDSTINIKNFTTKRLAFKPTRKALSTMFEYLNFELKYPCLQ